MAKHSASETGWGDPPWNIDFTPPPQTLPEQIDIAMIGGGFTGLAAAAWARRLDPGKSVAVFEAEHIGAGASGRTGGMVLGETAVGDLPGLGDVLEGFQRTLRDLQIDCDLRMRGGWEIGRRNALPESPINWQDSGRLRVMNEVPGGTADPGKLVSGLGRAAHRLGAMIYEHRPVKAVHWRGAGKESFTEIDLGNARIRAGKILFATNAMDLETSGIGQRSEPKFTLALATEPLDDDARKSIGLAEGKPFYTVDFPYLWGRAAKDDAMIWGAGLVHLKDWRELDGVDVSRGEARKLLDLLEARVRGLHPALRLIRVTHRWGGPILIGDGWRPIFEKHPQGENGLVLGAFAGHGVALSVYLGCWAAEALLARRDLPNWS
jgi:glycine/D-amino acid oxidase-like deaminating enzyme